LKNNTDIYVILLKAMSEKQLYIIAGCNGAGKTTASYTILPEIIDCKEFVNADEIAKGLSPFQPDRVSFEAGRIMLNRVNELLNSNDNFAFETTLATKSYKDKIKRAQKQGFVVTLLFFWLENIELAKERVKTRVLEGGHNIPEKIIERRYFNGIANLFNIYIDIVDTTLIFDNSNGAHELIAEKFGSEQISIINDLKFNQLKQHYGKKR
jgi:predicted ABC-type ATPase